ncbi:MAG TPA: NADH-quinone oxidoreductase subunit C [Candidatus Cryosericum sp.]
MTAEKIRQLLEQTLTKGRVACTGQGKRRVLIDVDAGDIKESVLAVLQCERRRFVTIVAVDNGLDIELLYNFSLDGVLVTLRASVRKETSTIDTIAQIVPGAEFVEKEVSELFGIEFVGHLRRANLVLPDDWPTTKRPMRKPLVGGIIPQARMSVENLLSGGASIRVGPSSLVKREKAGLPKVPPLASANDDQLKEFKDLVVRTGFDKRAGFDWGKGKLRYK